MANVNVSETPREVSIPLEDSGTEDTATNDTGDDGGDAGSDEPTQPDRAASQQPRGEKGKSAKAPRADRRSEYRDRQQTATEIGSLKAALARQEQQTAQFQREMLELRREATQRFRQPAAQPDASPIDQRIATLKQAMASEVAAARSHDHSKGPYDLARYEKLKEDLEDARLEANLPRILKARGIDLDRRPDPSQRPMSPRDVAQTAADVTRRDTMVAEAPWIADTSDPRHGQYLKAFTGTIEYLENVEGRPRGVNTDREAAAMVERRYGLQGRRQAMRPPRMPLGDNYRGGGDNDGPATLEVPSAQLDGVSPEIIKRAAARMRGRQG